MRTIRHMRSQPDPGFAVQFPILSLIVCIACLMRLKMYVARISADKIGKSAISMLSDASPIIKT